MRAAIVVSSSSPSIFPQQFLTRRRRNGIIRVSEAKLSESNAKRANLSARKNERIRLPNYGDVGEGKRIFHFSEFVNHPSGVDAILNTRALQSFQSLDSNMYRCILPQIQLFNFEVAPIVDLQITPTREDCIVEMLSCRFEGSELVERQNNHFSASMRNHITWETTDSESFLDVDVKLNLTLEAIIVFVLRMYLEALSLFPDLKHTEVHIYTHPFTLLPTSAVEGPGNLMMQTLMDRLVPLHAQQLLQDYDKWVHRQREICQ